MRVTLGQAAKLVKGNRQTLGSQITQEPGSGTASRHNASLLCRLISCSSGPDKALLFKCSHSAGNVRCLLIWGPPSISLVSAPQSRLPLYLWSGPLCEPNRALNSL